MFGATLEVPSYTLAPDAATIRGLPSTLIDIPELRAVESSDAEGPYSEIHLPEYFPPGSILVYSTHMEGLDATLDAFCAEGGDEAFDRLDLVDLNVLVHRADGEEKDATGRSRQTLWTGPILTLRSRRWYRHI